MLEDRAGALGRPAAAAVGAARAPAPVATSAAGREAQPPAREHREQHRAAHQRAAAAIGDARDRNGFQGGVVDAIAVLSTRGELHE